MSYNQILRIGDGSGWTFVNADWCDGSQNALMVPDEKIRQNGSGIQGHHYAFLREKVYGDIHASFEFRLYSHSDVGIIIRAADPSHFHLLHFPNCGQASRAQHFWSALSRMDDSGYLRIVKMGLTRRVPSNNGIWLNADITLRGNSVSARIGSTGWFEAVDPMLPESGRIGVYLFGRGEIRNLNIEGGPLPLVPWKDQKKPPTNWFHPCPDTCYGQWQRPEQLVLTSCGDLLLNYTVQEHPYRGKITALMVRSKNKGRTWSKPKPLDGLKEGKWEGHGAIHVFPDGKLRMLMPGEDFRLSESRDDGRIWLPPEPVTVFPPPEGIERLHLGPQAFVNLSDGSVIMFGYGRHDSTDPDSTIFTWGSHHCQAFACRSKNNGRTWTPWVNVDGARDDQGHPVTGSLDLTEVCGVQIGDKRILALIRPIFSPWMWETWSSDGGATWAPCVRGQFPGYATANMLRTESGAILVSHRLPGCTIHTSTDDGLTWDQGTLIDSAVWVMGSILEVEPDLVLYIYWDSFESMMRAQFIRITPQGLVPVRRRRKP